MSRLEVLIKSWHLQINGRLFFGGIQAGCNANFYQRGLWIFPPLRRLFGLFVVYVLFYFPGFNVCPDYNLVDSPFVYLTTHSLVIDASILNLFRFPTYA